MSSKALLVILQTILDRIKDNNEPVFVDQDVSLLIEKLKKDKNYECSHVGVIRSEDRWKVWLCIGAISLYLSIEEVIKIVDGVEELDFSSLPVH